MLHIKEQYKSLDEIISLVNKFETCEIEPDEFTHRAHITVATWYLTQSGFDEGEMKMKEGLHSFLSHYNLHGYNETITLFWLKAVQDFLTQSEIENSLLSLVNNAVAAFSNSKLIFEYYSEELAKSEEAKASWVEPDLKPFDSSFKFSGKHDGNT